MLTKIGATKYCVVREKTIFAIDAPAAKRFITAI